MKVHITTRDQFGVESEQDIEVAGSGEIVQVIVEKQPTPKGWGNPYDKALEPATTPDPLTENKGDAKADED